MDTGKRRWRWELVTVWTACGLHLGAALVLMLAAAVSGAAAASPGLPASPWAGEGRVQPLDASHIAACTACHGPQGRATPSGYFPRLAGKPQEYLYQQLLNFREGRRNYPLMGQLLRHLNDDSLQSMAHYFSQLEVPYPVPEAATATSADLARGEQLVRHGDAVRGIPACATCHGAQLTGSLPAVPGLLGLSRDYLDSQLGAWRAGRRSARAPDCMAHVAQSLAQEDVAQLTAWLSSQAVPTQAHAAVPSSVSWPFPCGAAPQSAQPTGEGGRP